MRVPETERLAARLQAAQAYLAEHPDASRRRVAGVVDVSQPIIARWEAQGLLTFLPQRSGWQRTRDAQLGKP